MNSPTFPRGASNSPWEPARLGVRIDPDVKNTLSLTGQCTSFWHRPFWLQPEFWETSAQLKVRKQAATNPPFVWVEIDLASSGQRLACQVAVQTDIPAEKQGYDFRLTENLSGLISDGHLTISPFHVRLPAGLQFELIQKAHQKLRLDLTHPLLGSLITAHILLSTNGAAKEPIPC
jgi:hypothetical protein